MFVFSRAGFLSLTSSDPGKNANQKGNHKRTSAKTNCPLIPVQFRDTESENESVKSFPASTLFDQIKLCVLFDWNWIVVKGQAFKFIQWEGKISEVLVLLQYLILNQHSLIKDKEKTKLYPNGKMVLKLNTF